MPVQKFCISKSRKTTSLLTLTYRPLEFTNPMLGKTVDWIADGVWCASVWMLCPEEKLFSSGVHCLSFPLAVNEALLICKAFFQVIFYDFDDRKAHKFTNDKNCDKNIRKYLQRLWARLTSSLSTCLHMIPLERVMRCINSLIVAARDWGMDSPSVGVLGDLGRIHGKERNRGGCSISRLWNDGCCLGGRA